MMFDHDSHEIQRKRRPVAPSSSLIVIVFGGVMCLQENYVFKILSFCSIAATAAALCPRLSLMLYRGVHLAQECT